MNPLDEAKTIAMVVLACVSLFLGLIPIWISRRLNWKAGGREMSPSTKNVLSGLLCFGGGVLMATALTHLLPEVHDGVQTLQEEGYISDRLPLAEIFFSAGFFLVYLVEEIVIESPSRRDESSDHQSHHHHIMEDGDNVSPSVRGLLIILGVSLHEIFEGVAIGLEKSEQNVWSLFAAVATHKFVIAFCVGIEMATNGVRMSLHVSYILVLSVVTSIGIGIGMALINNDTSKALDLTTLVLQGLAGGTLIYVAFFEVLERERSKSSIKLLRWITLLLGYIAMIGLELLIPEPTTSSEPTSIIQSSLTNCTSS